MKSELQQQISIGTNEHTKVRPERRKKKHTAKHPHCTKQHESLAFKVRYLFGLFIRAHLRSCAPPNAKINLKKKTKHLQNRITRQPEQSLTISHF